MWYVEDPRRLVGPLDEFPELDELPALAARVGRVRQPLEEVGVALDVLEELVGAGGPHVRGAPGLHEQVELVYRLPHLDRDLVADHPGVLARREDAGQDRVRVAQVEGEELGDGPAFRSLVVLVKQLLVAGAGEERPPVLPKVRVVVSPEIEDELQVHLEQAGDVLGALDVPAHPVEAVRDAREHHVGLRPGGGDLRSWGHGDACLGGYLSPASTQVSLEPPPCDELTTREPFLSATRVRPPGVTTVFSPHST